MQNTFQSLLFSEHSGPSISKYLMPPVSGHRASFNKLNKLHYQRQTPYSLCGTLNLQVLSRGSKWTTQIWRGHVSRGVITGSIKVGIFCAFGMSGYAARSICSRCFSHSAFLSVKVWNRGTDLLCPITINIAKKMFLHARFPSGNSNKYRLLLLIQLLDISFSACGFKPPWNCCIRGASYGFTTIQSL